MEVATPPEDRFAIQDLMARYAWALDTGDYETYATLFTRDGVFVERGEVFQGRAALAEHVRELAAVMRPGNRHHNTQLLFEVPQLAAHRRLGNAQTRRRPTYVQFFRDGHEIT